MKAAYFSVQQHKDVLGRKRAFLGASQFDEGEFFQGKERNCTGESAPCDAPFEKGSSEKNNSGQVMPHPWS